MAFQIKVNDSVSHELTTSNLESAHIVENADGTFNMIVDNKSHDIEILSISKNAKEAQLKINGQIYTYELKTDLDQMVDDMGFSVEDVEDMKELKSPMPGIILNIPLEIGMEVEVDTPLLILEAMKMENVIKSKSAQIVKEIHVAVGESVNKDALLVTFE